MPCNDVVTRLPHHVEVEQESAVREVLAVDRERMDVIPTHEVGDDHRRSEQRGQDEDGSLDEGPKVRPNPFAPNWAASR